MAAAFCAAVLMLSVTSCRSSRQLSADNLAGEWNVTTLNGKNIDGANVPFIGIDVDGKRVYGNAGCNRIMGSLELDASGQGKLSFGQVAATRMMCPDMELETAVLDALNVVGGYSLTENGLQLTDGDGNVVITLTRREALAVDLEGEWIINAVNSEPVEKLDVTPFLAFNVAEQRVNGNAGCNLVSGSFTVGDSGMSLKFDDNMISTMMAGPGLETEQKVKDALSRVAKFELNGDRSQLTLLDATGTAVLTLTRNTGAPLSK